ncbi:Nudix family hydrolase [Nitrosomonas aestuarii]|uniref:Nudix family hydrolase n=1 Tax=Nitrosomonas aestuarii TaxID=52441 RepID=UPI00313A0D60
MRRRDWKHCSGRWLAVRAVAGWHGSLRVIAQAGGNALTNGLGMTATDASTVVAVAAAVITQPDGNFLLTCRPEGKPYAGYWEFPGGKVEAEETPLQALGRELQEELGIQIQKADPWITRIFNYSHATVCLHFFRITQWYGKPWGREGQQLSWQSSVNITVSPILPANAPVFRALSLPSVYAITHASQQGVEASLQQIEQAFRNGLRLIQVREKEMDEKALRLFSEKVVWLAHDFDARVLLNSNMVLSRQLGADGVHLTGPQLMTLPERPDQEYGWCGASCHNVEELDQAEKLGLDFVVLGPVLPTLSHPGIKPLGWQKFAALIRHYPLPVYALGGLKLDDLVVAQELGAHGVAMMRGIDGI